jgi:hypothetical protein
LVKNYMYFGERCAAAAAANDATLPGLDFGAGNLVIAEPASLAQEAEA